MNSQKDTVLKKRRPLIDPEDDNKIPQKKNINDNKIPQKKNIIDFFGKKTQNDIIPKNKKKDETEIINKPILTPNITPTPKDTVNAGVTPKDTKNAGVTPKLKKDHIYTKVCKIRTMDDSAFKIPDDAPFSKGEPVPFFFITDCFNILESTKGKDSQEKKKTVISNMLACVDDLAPHELGDVYLFCTVRIDSEFQQDDLGIGNHTILKAMSSATGRDAKSIKDEINKVGDWGKVMEDSKAGQSKMETFGFKKKGESKGRLTFGYVMDKIRQMAKTHGTKSNTIKEAYINEILFDASPIECRYVIRFLQKNFKMGAAESSFQQSLARVYFMRLHLRPKGVSFDSKIHGELMLPWEKKLQKVINQYPFHKNVIDALQKISDIDELPQHCHIITGIPCKPQLAKPTKDISIIFKRFEDLPFTCEYKYDGLRGQIHYDEGKCDIFSRNLENMTETYPDVIDHLKAAIDKDVVKSLIVDSEIVAYDFKHNRILPFQTLMTRSKKNVDIKDIEIGVCIYIFDLLLFNGESYLGKTLQERRDCLFSNVKEITGQVQYTTYENTMDADAIQDL